MTSPRVVASVVAVVACVLAWSPAWAQHEAQEAKAVEAAKAWLVLIDTGKFEQSWDAAAPFFRSQVMREKWDARLVNSRVPLGRVLSRTLSQKQWLDHIENAPKSEYVVMLFKTAYDNMPKAVETITAMVQIDGTWRVCGYKIGPPEP
jgi:hypothetical protein